MPQGKNDKLSISTILTPAGAAVSSGILSNDSLMGIIEFSHYKTTFRKSINKNIPYLKVDIATFSSKPYLEIWYSESKITYSSVDNISFSTDGENLFATASIEEKNISLHELTERKYDQIFNIFRQNNASPCRIWNYIPRINQIDSYGQQRYKAFCSGRADSFNNYSIDFPAGTATGSLSDRLCLYFIGSNVSDPIHLENPGQTPAYKYPVENGFKPPAFARATYYKRNNGHFNIYISGTASVTGSDSVHPGDAIKQCLTALHNIELLISPDNLGSYNIDANLTLKHLDCIKVYIRNDSDFPAIKNICEKNFPPQASIVYLHSEMCRAELLVEIEGIVSV